MEGVRPVLAPHLQVLQGYWAGGFTVSGVRHAGSILVLPELVLAWVPTDPTRIDLGSLDALRTTLPAPEILMVGMGPGFVPFPAELRQAVRAWGPVVEAMATPAACRTYNVLLAEGRRVAAALIAMPAT